MFKIGTRNVVDIRIGETKIDKVMLGTTQVWSRQSGRKIYVMCGNGGVIQTSTNGTTWNEHRAGTLHLSAIACGNNMFVAGGPTYDTHTTPNLHTSPDGITWTDTGHSSNFESIIYGDGRFFAYLNNILLSSTDAVNWSKITIPDPDVSTWELRDKILSIAYGDGRLVVISDSFSDPIHTTTDFERWKHNSIDVYNNICSNVLFADGLFYFSTYFNSASARHIDFHSFNGFNVVGLGSIDKLYTDYFITLAYGNNTFVACLNNAEIYTSQNCKDWKKQDKTFENRVRNLTYVDGMFVLFGVNGTIHTSVDGENWTTQTVGNITLNAIAFSN